MKGIKAALVVNTASKCGNTKKHFREMVELEEWSSKSYDPSLSG